MRLTPSRGEHRPPAWRRALPLGLSALATLLLCAPVAPAAEQVINSSGPLTQVSLGDDLACQITRAGDAQPAFYAGNNLPGSCGTFIHTGGSVNGPPTAPAAFTPVAYTPVSQTPVSGAGTAANPFRVTTVVSVVGTQLQVSRTDSYATGFSAYRSDITVSNLGSLQATAILYHAGDCLLNGSDTGFGFFRPADGGIFCAESANNTPAGRILGFIPLSPASSYLESGAVTAPDQWVAMNGSAYPDLCNCATAQDNGMGLSWALTVPASGSVTRSLTTAFEVPASTTTPPPAAPPPAAAGLPAPVLGTTVNVAPVGGGQVLVSEPVAAAERARASVTVPGIKGRNFVPLTAARQIAVGAILDTRRGGVQLQSARDTKGTIQSGEFRSGVFQVLQSGKRSANGLTELRLKGSSFRSCSTSGRGAAASAARRSQRRIRRLRGNAQGRFRTRGRYSAATVRGTIWEVQDRCDGTLTKVTRGRVAVRDFRRGRTISLRAGKRYLARAPG